MAARDLDEHRVAASVEDAVFLLTDGVPFATVARRVHLSTANLEKRLRRAGYRKDHDEHWHQP